MVVLKQSQKYYSGNGNVFYLSISKCVVVYLMDRSEAVKILREVFSTCSIDNSFVALMESSPEDKSHGYQIHIKTNLNQKDRECILKILDREGLMLKETKDRAIIYKPIKVER